MILEYVRHHYYDLDAINSLVPSLIEIADYTNCCLEYVGQVYLKRKFLKPWAIPHWPCDAAIAPPYLRSVQLRAFSIVLYQRSRRWYFFLLLKRCSKSVEQRVEQLQNVRCENSAKGITEFQIFEIEQYKLDFSWPALWVPLVSKDHQVFQWGS